MRSIDKIIFILFLTGVSLLAQENVRPAHHTDDGFQNPFPTYEDRGFGDFLQWSVVDRIKGKKPEKPDQYHFDIIENNGQALRKNEKDYTVTWVGHSTLLIQMEGINILTDPIWSERPSPLQLVGPKRHVPPGIAFEDLPPIDVVLISHNHYDHLDRLTLERLGNDPLYLVPLKIGDFLSDIGITNYEELDWWDSIKYNGMTFTCTPTQHFSNRGLFDRNKTLWCSWVAAGKTSNFYFAGDTGYFPGFKEIGEKYGPFDVVAMPIGAYLPRWFMGPVHVDPPEAVQAFLDLQGQIFVPIHWGTFEMADELLDQPPKDLMTEIERLDLNKKNFWLLKHGETRWLPEKKIARK